MNIEINKTSIDCGLWAIQRNLMQKYGCDVAAGEMYPLLWYVNTGRASTEFLKRLINAKPFMIARILHRGGADAEIINRIKNYLKMPE